MMNMPRILRLILIILFLAGCQAVGVPYTSDPHEKLYWANGLVHKANRPLPAESLIRSSIHIFKEQKDELGLAEAYRYYGSFFSSDAVTLHKAYFEKNGFREKSASFENRYTVSIDYFKKAKEIYLQYGRYEDLASLNVNMGLTYALMKNPQAACQSFKDSLDSYETAMKLNPNFKIVLPPDIESFEALLEAHKIRNECIR